jgi:hypothetical protein
MRMGINKKNIDESLEPNHPIDHSHEVAQRNVTPVNDLGGVVAADPKT